jgi:hypothetical protein
VRSINREFFKNPQGKPEFSVAPFWFWNDLINDEQSVEQLGMMRRIGANEPIIHARTGLETEYLSEEWFSRVETAIQPAQTNGQKLWLYDEKTGRAVIVHGLLQRKKSTASIFLILTDWRFRWAVRLLKTKRIISA